MSIDRVEFDIIISIHYINLYNHIKHSIIKHMTHIFFKLLIGPEQAKGLKYACVKRRKITRIFISS